MNFCTWGHLAFDSALHTDKFKAAFTARLHSHQMSRLGQEDPFLASILTATSTCPRKTELALDSLKRHRVYRNINMPKENRACTRFSQTSPSLPQHQHAQGKQSLHSILSNVTEFPWPQRRSLITIAYSSQVESP